MSKYLSITEVCELLGVSRDKLRDLEKAGEVPAPIVLGRSKKWPDDELDQFLKERRSVKESA